MVEIKIVTVCCYCGVEVKSIIAKTMADETDIERGYVISHGSCEACHKEIMEQIKNGTYGQ